MLFYRPTILSQHLNHSALETNCTIVYFIEMFKLPQSAYKEPSLACSWLMTQAAGHVTRTDVTRGQIITPQQVQGALFPFLILILLQLVFLLHVENICIGGPSISSYPPLFLSPPPSFTPTPLFCLLVSFSFDAGKGKCLL